MEYKDESNTMGTSGIESNLLEVACTRAVTETQFPKGVMDFPFSVGGSWSWIPARSYFRMRVRVSNNTNGVTGAPIKADNIALADNFCNNMFNNCFFRAGQQDVSSITSFLPQAAQVKHRLHKSGAWTKSVGNSALGLEPSYEKRLNQLASDGVDTTEPSAQAYLVHLNGATAATGAVTAVTGAVALTGATLWQSIQVGDVMTVGGNDFTVQTKPTAADGTGMTVLPANAEGAANATFTRPNSNSYQNKRELEFVFQPPLGIFDYDKPMYGGDYRISLNPIANYKQAAIQSLVSLSSSAGQFNFEVTDMHFYVSLIKMNNPMDSVIRLNLTECAIQTKTYSSTLDFSVPPSTFALAIYVQGSDAGSNTQVPPSLFKCKDKSDENLQQFQITYSNVSKPSTDWSSQLIKDTVPGDGNGKNFMVQRFYDTLSEAGLTLESGGTETFEDWLARGGLYFYSFLRSADDKSTHVQVRMNYPSLESSALVHIAALYNVTSEITSTQGRISSVTRLAV